MDHIKFYGLHQERAHSFFPDWKTCLLPSNPLSWSRDNVKQWLEYCIDEYSFTDVNVERFSMNGKALALLNKKDFTERAPHAGAVLYNVVHKLIESGKTSSVPSFPSCTYMSDNAALGSLFTYGHPFRGIVTGRTSHSLQTTIGKPSNKNLVNPPNTLSELRHSSSKRPTMVSPLNLSDYSEIISNNQKVHSAVCHNNTHPSHDSAFQSSLGIPEATQSPPPKNATIGSPAHNHINEALSLQPEHDCKLLWEFLSKLLKDGNFTEYIRWENLDDFTFRIVNPGQLSKLWGSQKNRSNMTYEKLSRALRFYYKMNIIEKVPGKRLTYRFMRPPHEIKRGRRGAKPGIPRKDKKLDDETEGMYELADSDYEESNSSKDCLNDSAEIEPYKTYPGCEMSLSKDDQPIALVNHSRQSAFTNNHLLHLEKCANGLDA